MLEETTPNRLLEHGKRLFLERGYHAIGIQEILKAAAVPKGSFYHYFGSKETFALAVLEHYFSANERALLYWSSPALGTPLARLRGYFQEAIVALEQAEFRTGCLLGNLGQELTGQRDAVQAKIAELFVRWRLHLIGFLEQARGVGELPPEGDLEHLATLLLNLYEGTVIQAKVERSSAAFEGFLRVLERPHAFL